MFDYRLYFMKPQTGQILRFAEYQAPNDEAAISLAREEEGNHALELWSGGRKVQRIEPVDSAFRIAARWKQALSKGGQPSASGVSSAE